MATRTINTIQSGICGIAPFVSSNKPDLTEFVCPLESVSTIRVSYQVNLTKVSFPNLKTVDSTYNYFDMQYNSGLLEVDMPKLETYIPVGSNYANMNIRYNPALTGINIPSLTFTPNLTWDFRGNHLSVECVNALLALVVSKSGELRTSDFSYPYNTFDLSGGTNAAPSGQGVVDKQTLKDMGITFTTN